MPATKRRSVKRWRALPTSPTTLWCPSREMGLRSRFATRTAPRYSRSASRSRVSGSLGPIARRGRHRAAGGGLTCPIADSFLPHPGRNNKRDVAFIDGANNRRSRCRRGGWHLSRDGSRTTWRRRRSSRTEAMRGLENWRERRSTLLGLSESLKMKSSRNFRTWLRGWPKPCAARRIGNFADRSKAMTDRERRPTASTGLDRALIFAVGCIGLVTAVSLVSKRPGQDARERAYGARSETRSQAGELASRPTEIPPDGWWDIARRTYSELNRDRVPAVAAGVTFYSLLALFPALTAFVSLYGLVNDPAAIGRHLTMLDPFLPGGAREFLTEQVPVSALGQVRRSASLSSSAWPWPCGAPMPASKPCSML